MYLTERETERYREWERFDSKKYTEQLKTYELITDKYDNLRAFIFFELIYSNIL